MTLPGWRLRAWAARWCEPRTMTRLVDPILADLQAEHHEALMRGSVWRSRLAWLRALVALARVGAVHSLWVRPYEERRHVSRALVVTAASFVVFVAILCAPLAWFMSPSALVYMVPGAVPVAIPAALVCGIVVGLGQVRQRLRSWLVVLSVVASAVSWYVVASVLPASSQAIQQVFRSELERPRSFTGASQLTPREAGPQRAAALAMRLGAVRGFAYRYYSRSALSLAPLVLVVTVLALTSRRRWLDVGIGVALVLGYFGSLGWAHLVYESQIAKAWVPNTICLVLATGSMLLRSERARHEAVRQ